MRLMFGKRSKFPIPPNLPEACDNCGARLRWEAVTWVDPNIREEKVDHYRAACSCGRERYRDGRGQVVEPAKPNLPPDLSEFAFSPQGQQWFPGTAGYAEAEAKAAEQARAVAAAAAAKAAAAKAAQAEAAPAAAPSAPAEAVPAAQPAAAVPAASAEAVPAPVSVVAEPQADPAPQEPEVAATPPPGEPTA